MTLVSSHNLKDRGRARLGDWANGTNIQHHRVASQTSWMGGGCRVRPGFPPIARARGELRRLEARLWSMSPWERPRSDLRATQERPKRDPSWNHCRHCSNPANPRSYPVCSWSNIYPSATERPQSSALPFWAANSPFFAILCCA